MLDVCSHFTWRTSPPPRLLPLQCPLRRLLRLAYSGAFLGAFPKPFYAAKHSGQPGVRKAASVVQSEESMALASGVARYCLTLGFPLTKCLLGTQRSLFGNTLHDSTQTWA